MRLLNSYNLRLVHILLYIFFLGNLSAQIPTKKCAASRPVFDSKLHQDLTHFTQKWIAEGANFAQSRGAITIPVVVHIVYQTETGNISEAQIQSQIAALNRDFNRANKNLDRVHLSFKDRIAKIGFTFCLATIDPEGNPTNGITRTRTDEENIFTQQVPWVYYANQGGQDAWDTEKYLNIWVTQTDLFLGFASFPGEKPPLEQGIVIAPKAFGTMGTAQPPFHLGRTLTHEVGHYFNLFHPWGSKASCDKDDFVEDTPLQSELYAGCPAIESSSCNSRDITANFMNNSEDDCLAMFTRGQALRMQAALIFARKGLLNSQGCGEITSTNPRELIKVYPNPASYYFCIEANDLAVEELAYKMINTKGAIIQEGKVLANTIQHIPTFQNGLYFLQFFIGTEVIIKKIIITPN